MCYNIIKLKMNNDKTEIMVCGTIAKRKQVNVDNVNIGNESIAFSSEVKDLGVYIDSNISFNKHVSFLRKSCYFELRKISNIRPFITKKSAKQLAVSLILSKLDYCIIVIVCFMTCLKKTFIDCNYFKIMRLGLS